MFIPSRRAPRLDRRSGRLRGVPAGGGQPAPARGAEATPRVWPRWPNLRWPHWPACHFLPPAASRDRCAPRCAPGPPTNLAPPPPAGRWPESTPSTACAKRARPRVPPRAAWPAACRPQSAPAASCDRCAPVPAPPSHARRPRGILPGRWAPGKRSCKPFAASPPPKPRRSSPARPTSPRAGSRSGPTPPPPRPAPPPGPAARPLRVASPCAEPRRRGRICPRRWPR